MAVCLKSDDRIFLVGNIESQILGAKLPSKRQVLQVLFFNTRRVNLFVRETANLTIQECIIFWVKARIPTRYESHCVNNLFNLYDEWRFLKKNANRVCEKFHEPENKFEDELNNLFDIARVDAIESIKIEEDRQFLIQQRQPGRSGSFGNIDMKTSQKEE